MNRPLREGIKNIRRNGWMSFASISALAFMFLLVGSAAAVIFNIHHMTKKVEKDVEIRAYLEEGVDHELLLQKIRNLGSVEKAVFIPKEQGLSDFANSLGSDGKAFEMLKEDNPLNDVIVIRTKDPLNTPELAAKIKEFGSIEKMNYGEKIVDPLFKTTNFVRTVGFIFIAGLTLISLYIVSNTIHLTVMARKDEIKLQKLIGATNSFVSRPFLVEGGIIGLGGAIIPALVLSLGYQWVYRIINGELDVAVLQILPPGIFLTVFSSGIILGGILIGMCGALFSVNRFLKV
ncbi:MULTISPECIES: permease-like cell division protein FtsX [Pseudobacillus]|uniref:permease-like cell division protein FtsX n=1 Tax=Pseudobacillus TaxID=108525 RepID=UPI00387A06BE